MLKLLLRRMHKRYFLYLITCTPTHLIKVYHNLFKIHKENSLNSMHLPQILSHSININKCCSRLSIDVYFLKSSDDDIMRSLSTKKFRKICDVGKICGWKMMIRAKKGKKISYPLFLNFKIYL